MTKAKPMKRSRVRVQAGSAASNTSKVTASNSTASNGTASSGTAPSDETKPQQLVSIAAAEEAGLRYVSPNSPGITRKRAGKGFYYIDAAGQRIRDVAILARIRSLVIPPAWEQVWICSSPRGHLQAVGVDARGRKQYRYHEEFRRVRDEAKYGKLLDFVRVLPKIRRRIRADLQLSGMPREKVLAAVVHLLESTQIRVGNDEYARQNQSFGLTTLRNKHARVIGARVQFNFRGKSGVEHAVDLNDKRLAQIIRRCQELPGEELFTYLDDQGNAHDVGSADVNAYLREITGQDFTAKDFRTWAGTVLATEALRESLTNEEARRTERARKQQIVAAIDLVAAQLRNTRAVCRKCYIHPAVIESYLDGSFVTCFGCSTTKVVRQIRGLKSYEVAVVALVQQFVKRAAA